jgi:type II secretion system (T2SS) protein M
MNVSERDKKILVILVPLVVVLGYWFLLLAPKREAASAAAVTLESEQAALADAEAQASTISAAKDNFARDYSAVVALGKAIPTSVDMPSLLVQLEQAARGTGIELDGVTAGERETVAPAAPTGTVPGAPAPGSSTPTAPSGQPPQSAPGTAAANAQSAADTASAGNTASDPSAAGSATTSTDPAAAGTDPAGGALESVSLEFKFTGEFFSLANFFHRLKRFVYVEGDNVRVRGRLMTIDGVEYTADPDIFPSLTATVQATVYLSPKAEGVTAGATPAGPEAASTTTAPAAATASTGSSSPTPAATATP